MDKTVFTPKYTMMMVQEIEKKTGKPVSMYKRHELQQLLLMWYLEVTRNEQEATA